ncbi:hypothetical protein KC980_02750 [candidate division WWE3 bacterium]|uniref:Uncharacterized protein n=1 Tax=candidate division WWE3 bacterium TaxID=2053526 RepID=A0A955J1U6_UNCKA|nr:hypothetical protein [candidate division WWE3 bacterium]
MHKHNEHSFDKHNLFKSSLLFMSLLVLLVVPVVFVGFSAGTYSTGSSTSTVLGAKTSVIENKSKTSWFSFDYWFGEKVSAEDDMFSSLPNYFIISKR